MISYLLGKPVPDDDGLTMIVQGVGYAVRVTPSVRQKALSLSELALHIHTHVREDAIELYGFMERGERQLFLLLINVSGIGPKTALNIVEQGSTKLVAAVQDADVTFFSAIPRVGKKLAQKIIIELRGKLGAIKELDLTPLSAHHTQVIEALQGLGFDERSVHLALEHLAIEELSLSEAVTQALKLLGQQA
jgi:Holliday junction DNA helicase RuvA